MAVGTPRPAVPRHAIHPAEVPGSLVPDGSEPVVRASDVEKYFGSNHVLRGCSMTVYPRETITILGRSGSGKSTFLRCLNFLEEPSAGRIDIDGVVVDASPLTRRDRAASERCSILPSAGGNAPSRGLRRDRSSRPRAAGGSRDRSSARGGSSCTSAWRAVPRRHACSSSRWGGCSAAERARRGKPCRTPPCGSSSRTGSRSPPRTCGAG